MFLRTRMFWCPLLLLRCISTHYPPPHPYLFVSDVLKNRMEVMTFGCITAGFSVIASPSNNLHLCTSIDPC